MRFWLLVLLAACGGDSPTSTTVDPAEPVVTEPETPAPPEEPEPEPLPAPTDDKYAATHVLVAWAGAARAPATVTRSEAEARTLAEELHARAVAGEDIEALAREYSDGPSAPRGGSLGVYLTGTMVPGFEAAVASVEVGAIAPLTKTAFGWHVARRDAVVEARASHILVGFEGAWRSTQTRTREEALARVEEAKARLDAGEDFATVAAEMSDGPTASVGGDLGPIAPGQMIPDFEAALFDLEKGARSDVVETPYGFHLVLRTE